MGYISLGREDDSVDEEGLCRWELRLLSLMTAASLFKYGNAAAEDCSPSQP